MQLCRIIYYSIAPRLLYMFRAILSPIIRSTLTVITASGFIHMCCCRVLSLLNRNYSVITASGFIHMCCCRVLSLLSRNYSATKVADNNTCE